MSLLDIHLLKKYMCTMPDSENQFDKSMHVAFKTLHYSTRA